MKYLIKVKEQYDNISLSDSKMKILVIDTNLGLDHALRFAEDGHEVYYCNGDISAYPKIEDTISGDGFENIIKVSDIGEPLLRGVDFVYIVDSCFGYLADWLRDKGYNVFGPSGEVVKLELDRVYYLNKLKELGISVPESTVLMGINDVISYLKKVADGTTKYFIKVSKYRGDIETVSVTTAEEAEVLLNQTGFGPYSNKLVFIVQKESEGVEIGCDALVSNGTLVRPLSFTIEEKGRGNVAVWRNNSGFNDIFSRLEKYFKDNQYNGMFCLEGFWDGAQFKVIDVTPRCSFPVSSLYPRYIENWSEVCYEISRGKMPDLKVDWGNPYMAEITVYTDEKNLWRTITVPESYKKEVGFRRAVKETNVINDVIWFVPGDGVVATVNTKGYDIKDTLNNAYQIANQIDCSFTDVNQQFQESVLSKIQKLNNLGDSFSFKRENLGILERKNFFRYF